MTPGLDSLLGAPALIWLNQQDDSERLSGALDGCAHALAVMDALEVESFELPDIDLPDLSAWNEAAPRVRDSLRAIYDFTASLDRAYRDDQAISALVDLIRHDAAALGAKLRDPSIVSSRWTLVAELQAFKKRAVQSLEGVAATLLEPLAGHNLGALLPRTSVELQRNLDLRDEITVLIGSIANESEQIGRSNDEGVAALLDALLARFVSRPCYRWMWVRDQRELVSARASLKVTGPALTHAVQDLIGFLELLLSSLSERPDVEAYDRESAELAALLTS